VAVSILVNRYANRASDAIPDSSHSGEFPKEARPRTKSSRQCHRLTPERTRSACSLIRLVSGDELSAEFSHGLQTRTGAVSRIRVEWNYDLALQVVLVENTAHRGILISRGV
jgi:hypothetical protein